MPLLFLSAASYERYVEAYPKYSVSRDLVDRIEL